ncbi:MAG: hypothetical protein ACREMD_05350, partial [Gemmatimonadota bacterium]
MLDDELPESLTLTIHLQGPSTIVIECSEDQPCGDRIFLADFTPSHVMMTITTESLDFTADFALAYQITYPNTPDCPPECERATIVV